MTSNISSLCTILLHLVPSTLWFGVDCLFSDVPCYVFHVSKGKVQVLMTNRRGSLLTSLPSCLTQPCGTDTPTNTFTVGVSLPFSVQFFRLVYRLLVFSYPKFSLSFLFLHLLSVHRSSPLNLLPCYTVPCSTRRLTRLVKSLI